MAIARIKKLQNRVGGCLSLLALLLVASCGGSGGGSVAPRSEIGSPAPDGSAPAVGEVVPTGAKRVISTSEIRPYRPASSHASVLAECVAVEFIESICTLSKLPYIGQTSNRITIDQIMDRVLVTHDWMGVRLEEMLNIMPADIVQMFAPVTVIVIGSEVRPSSFTPALGMMMLDPYDLWLNVDEKQTVSAVEDYRSDFGADLQFMALWRPMIGERYASYYWPLDDDSIRGHDDIEIPLAHLLYHELAHANDFVQPDSLASLGGNITPYDAIEQLAHLRVSSLLLNDRSLTTPDAFFDKLAGIRFRDEEAGAEHLAAQPDFVGAKMDAAGKINFYSYVSEMEDVATLLETAMMKYHYGVDTHVAYTSKPADLDNAACDDLKVGWGVRNRLSSSLVLPRAKFVVDKMVPSSVAVDNFFAGDLGPETPLRLGDGWCSSRFLNPQSPGNTPSFMDDQPEAFIHTLQRRYR